MGSGQGRDFRGPLKVDHLIVKSLSKEAWMDKKIKKWRLWAVATVLVALARLGYCDTPDSKGLNVPAGSPDTEWNTTLPQFRALKHSKVTFYVDPMEARLLDYLLMDCHEVNKDDPARFPGFSAQIAEGDPKTYVFYRGNLCLEATELTLKELEGARRDLRSKYGPPKKEYHCIGDDFSDSYGMIRGFYHFEAYNESSSTLVELVRLTGYYENQLYYDRSYDTIASSMGELMKVFVIHISKSYLQRDNAYSDWLEDKKNLAIPGTQMDYLQSLKRGIEH